MLANINRDPKKGSEYHWWEFMPRWKDKYENLEKARKQQALKGWLMAKASADKLKVQ